MKRIKVFSIWTLLISINFFLLSCEKEVSFNFKDAEKKTVVEGFIDNGAPPIVRLSNSMSYFGLIDFQNLGDIFIHDAYIEVSDGNRKVILKEYSMNFPDTDFMLYYYSIDSTKPEDLDFLGELGKTYSLKIIKETDTFYSKTHIHYPKPLDSLWTQVPDSSWVTDSFPEARELYALYDDPDTLGNFARIFTSINGSPFYTGGISVLSDELGNGVKINLPISPGVAPGDTSSDFASRYYFNLNDTVIVKWSAIDKATHDFYNSLEFSVGLTGNPFAAPIHVISNIEGENVLGIWAGYGSSYHSIIIKDPEP